MAQDEIAALAHSYLSSKREYDKHHSSALEWAAHFERLAAELRALAGAKSEMNSKDWSSLTDKDIPAGAIRDLQDQIRSQKRDLDGLRVKMIAAGFDLAPA